jgi:glycosyltransferase involved in cell wall biosynthesis
MTVVRNESFRVVHHKVACIVLNNFVNDSRVLKTCRSLLSHGYSTEVIALHDGRLDLPDSETVHGVPVHRIRLATKRWSRLGAVQVLKYFEFVARAARRARSADICHCNDLAALLVGAIGRVLSRGRLRVVYDAHEHESERNGFAPWQRFLTRQLERLLLRWADCVITVSPSIAEDYVRLYGIKAPAVIYNAPYYVEKRRKDLLRERLGIEPSRKIFLYQGTLIHGRGIELLLRVFAGLDQRCCLVLIGGGPLSSSIQQHAREHDNIFHIPFVDPLALWELTFSADFGIALIENTCRSYYFCLPNKLFEFMMAELPVVVSNMFELERFVTTHAVGVVSKVSEQALRGSIVALLQADQDRLVTNIRAVKALYTWEQQEAKLLELYANLGGVSSSAEPDRALARTR